MSRYHRLLLALLSSVVVFEGFDASVTNVVVPLIGKEFGAGPAELGGALSLVSLGAVAAFFTIRLADRIGRRRMLLLSVLGFSAFSLATAFAQSLQHFVVLQLGARICLVTQLSSAYILLSESLSAEARGRANGLMAAFASLGSAIPAMMLHTVESYGHDWRALFVIGAAPLLLLPLLWRYVREPDVYLAARQQGIRAPSIVSQLRTFLQPRLRVRFFVMSTLWFAISFWTAATYFFFTYYVFEQRGWTSADLQLVAPVALVAAFAGYTFAGWLMDRIGRRPATAVLLAASIPATLLCYQSTAFWAVAGGWVLLQAMLGIWAIAHVVNSELFPTEVRAAANGLCENLIGRWGFVLGPAVVGVLADALGGVHNAVTALVSVNLAILPLVWWALPETRHADLQRVQS